MEAVFKKVVARGEDLDIENRFVLIFAFHFAQIGRLSVDQQLLEELLAVGATDLHLEVATAGGAPPVVGGAAWRTGARIGIGHHGVKRQRPSRWRAGQQVAAHQLAAIDQLEMVAAQLSRLIAPCRHRDGASEAVRLAS